MKSHAVYRVCNADETLARYTDPHAEMLLAPGDVFRLALQRALDDGSVREPGQYVVMRCYPDTSGSIKFFTVNSGGLRIA